MCTSVAASAAAQETPISNTTLTTCGGFLVDTGLSAGDSSPNSDITMTVCPEAPETIITLYFALANLGPGDFLEIYDGPDTDSPLLGSFIEYGAQGLEIYAGAANTGGCLTLHFTSDATGNSNFVAEMTCGYPCERPIAYCTTGEDVPNLVCPGEEITFNATGSTVADGFEIVTWEWDFDDGSTDNSGGVVTHAFENPGAYKVQLSIADNNFDEDNPDGCANNNLIDHLILVSTEPDWSGSSVDATICSGQIFPLNGVVNGVTYDATPDANFGGGLFIPDDQSQCFSASLTFNGFNPGATVTDGASDILSYFINFEHSFMGDLTITFICPNGQSMTVHEQGGGGTFLGEPVDNDALPDAQGVGYDYWWAPTATNGTWADNAGGTLPSGTYEATGPWSLMNGCPLNGTWEVEICDSWGSDNGFIFDWTVNFDPSLYPDPIVFTPVFGMACDSTSWSGPSISSTESDCNGVTIQPNFIGTETYIYEATNNFGCTYEYPVEITVVQGPSIELAAAAEYCGSPVDLSGTVTNVNPAYTYTYSWSPAGPLNTASGPNVTVMDLDELTNFLLTVQVTGGELENCSGTESVFVDVLPAPVSFDLEELEICLGETASLVVPNQPQGLDEYLYAWTYSYPCDDPVTPELEMCSEPAGDTPAIAADESGVYSVVISMPDPCVWTAEGAFEVVAEPCELTIPNVFSPNNKGDGNDAFRVDGLDGYPRSTVRIYDRWGGLVYQSDDFGNSAGWSPKPDEASEGTYFYVLGVARNEAPLTVTNEDGGLLEYGGTGMKYFQGSLTLVR